jgi:hypothetical protein
MTPDEIRRSWDDDDTPRSHFPTPPFTQPRANRDAELVAYDQLSRENVEQRAEVERLLEAIGNIGQGYHSDTCRTNYAPQGPCNCFQAELRAVIDKPAGECVCMPGSEHNAATRPEYRRFMGLGRPNQEPKR